MPLPHPLWYDHRWLRNVQWRLGWACPFLPSLQLLLLVFRSRGMSARDLQMKQVRTDISDIWVSDPTPPQPCPGESLHAGSFTWGCTVGVDLWRPPWGPCGDSKHVLWSLTHPLSTHIPGSTLHSLSEGPLPGRLPSPVSFSGWFKSKDTCFCPWEAGCTFALLPFLLTMGSLKWAVKCQPLPLCVPSLMSDPPLNSPLLAWGLKGKKKTPPTKTCWRNLLWIKSWPCLILAGGWWLLMVKVPVWPPHNRRRKYCYPLPSPSKFYSSGLTGKVSFHILLY